jgi:peptidoglycan hydrolase-like protein with peptidoglycan-binding domain
MQISNTSDFTSASWIPFKETYTWILTPTQGIKTVYVRYGKNASVVGKAQDSITLTQTTPLGGASTAPLVSESMVKPAPVIKYSFAQTLTIGSRNQDVMELQKILIDAGYLYVNPPTNYFGPMTVAALKSYQKAHGLAQTGIVDHATQEILNGSSTQSHIENTTEKEELIKQLQVKLIELIAQLKLLKS